MEKKIFFISKSTENLLNKKFENGKVITFDNFSHKNLEKLGINHDLAENFLDYNERLWIFDSVIKFYSWFKDPSLKIFEFEGINLLSLLDKIEFASAAFQTHNVHVSRIGVSNSPNSRTCVTPISLPYPLPTYIAAGTRSA